MSHVTNVVSYSRLVDICSGHGGNYKPGNGNLQLKAMRALLEKAQSSLHDVSQKRDAYQRIQNERKAVFDNLGILANRVIGTLASLHVPEATIADARYFSRLIAGVRATPRLPIPSVDSADPALKTSGHQRLSYVAKADHFTNLVQMVQALPDYKTNEPELQIESLKEMAERMQQLNEDVFLAKAALTTARMERNRILYRARTGVVDVAMAAKRYVKVVFGTRSGEAAQLVKLVFTKQQVR
ncbi:MAG: hypothetical protein AB7K37_12285 [Cyclobacteriaceae bacterium]